MVVDSRQTIDAKPRDTAALNRKEACRRDRMLTLEVVWTCARGISCARPELSSCDVPRAHTRRGQTRPALGDVDRVAILPPGTARAADYAIGSLMLDAPVRLPESSCPTPRGHVDPCTNRYS
jgi:hypothetical protein